MIVWQHTGGTLTGRSVVAAIAAAMLLGLRAAGQEDIHQRYFEGLRSRGLYRLAETYCLDRLADERLEVGPRAQLTVELSRTFADHAAASGAGQGAVLWEQARKSINDFLQTNPTYSPTLLLRLQVAEVDLAEGEEGRWRWEASPQDTKLAQRSRALLHRALGTLKGLEAVVAGGVRDPDANEQTADFSRYRLRGLSDTIRYRQARAWLNLVRLSRAGSADAVDALAQASERLKPLAEAPPSESLHWNSRIELVECYRLQGDRDEAMRLLGNIERSEPPEPILHRAYAARARILMADGEVDRAAEGLRGYRELLARPNGELDLAYMEALLGQWEQAGQQGDTRRAKQYRQQVTELLEQLRQRRGAYWSRRCELLLAGYLRDDRVGVDSTLLAESAERLYRFGQVDGALELYRRAAVQADAEGQRDAAFELAFTEAGILLRGEQWEAAARRFAALAASEHRRAAQANLLAAYAWGRWYTLEPSPERLEAYEAALDGHLQRFVRDTTAGEAHWMYGRLRESQQRWGEAIEHYAAVGYGQRRYESAVLAGGRCYERLLSGEQDDESDRERIAGDAIVFLRTAAQVPDPGKPVSVAALASAVRLARVWIEIEPARYLEAKVLLARFLRAIEAAEKSAGQTTVEGTGPRGQTGRVQSSDADAFARWYASARQWYVLVLAGLGEIEQAEEQLAMLSASHPEELLELIEGLSELAGETSEELRQHLGKLQLRAARLLETQRDALEPEDRFRLDVLSAHAMAYSGQPRRALDHFGELLRRDPKNVALQEARAELLLLVEDEEAYAESLALWRGIEKQAQSGTPRWYRAKYYIALCHFRLGRRDECRKLIEVTRLLHPDLGGPAMQKRYLALLEQCRGEQ